MRGRLRAIALFAALAASFVARGAEASDCSRPTDPSGAGGYSYGASSVHSFGNASVLVWYATDGENAVNPASTRSDGVPDDVATVAQVTSDALASYAQMGFRAPVSDATNPGCGSNGGDARLDVYLVHMVGADGVTVAESGRCAAAGNGSTSSATTCASFVMAQSNFADFAAYYPTSTIGIRTVLPHETFHVVQNAYDAGLDRFWAEGTAQWAAKTLDPQLTDLERFLPAFFSQTSRSLDGPANGVTSDYLYGAAIWPVFLTQRHGSDIVRAILEQEAKTGGPALAATDVVLTASAAAPAPKSSLATEFATFSAWNAATGARAGSGGYANAKSYPSVSVAEMTDGGASGVTSGYASFYFHVKTSAREELTVSTDTTRNAATVVPLAVGDAGDGGAMAALDASSTLPSAMDGEGIVVVSGITTNKSDAPFTVTLAAIADAGEGAATNASGASPKRSSCAVTAESSGGAGSLVAFAAVASVTLAAAFRRGRRQSRIRASERASV